MLHSSVSTPAASIRDPFILALTSAGQRVWIQSTYFVPDEPTLTAMCVAAASGVDVRLMITGHPDKKVPFHVAHAHFGQLLASDVRVFLYAAGFLHAKTVTTDDDVAVVGTCNWDIRSLLLHDEVVAVLHDHERVREFDTRYEQDLRFCRDITRADFGCLLAAPLRTDARRSLMTALCAKPGSCVRQEQQDNHGHGSGCDHQRCDVVRRHGPADRRDRGQPDEDPPRPMPPVQYEECHDVGRRREGDYDESGTHRRPPRVLKTALECVEDRSCNQEQRRSEEHGQSRGSCGTDPGHHGCRVPDAWWPFHPSDLGSRMRLKELIGRVDHAAIPSQCPQLHTRYAADEDVRPAH